MAIMDNTRQCVLSMMAIHEIAVKSALLACTGEKGSLSCLWERTTAIVLTNYSPTVVG